MWQAGISLAAREFPGGSLGKKLAALPPKIARSPTPPGMQVTFHKIPYQATAPPQSWASNTQDLYPRAVTCSTNKPHIRSQIKTWPDATHLLVNSFSICSYCRAANCFRARSIVAVVCLLSSQPILWVVSTGAWCLNLATYPLSLVCIS